MCLIFSPKKLIADCQLVAMKLNYKFQNLLGAVYHKGTLRFSPDGNAVYSPVGNKIVVFDAKNCRSEALSFEAEYNIVNLSLSPNGLILLAASEKTHLYVVSLVSGIVLHRKEFKDIGERINDLKFSPDGRYYAVCGPNRILVYLTPGFVVEGRGRQMNPFKINKIINSNYEEASNVAWSGDSKLLAIGSRGMTIRIYPIDRTLKNVPLFVSLSGHTDDVISCHFANHSPYEYDLYSLSRSGHLFVWKANHPNLEELMSEPVEGEEKKLLNYYKTGKHYLKEHLKLTDTKDVRLTVSDYHNKLQLVVVGFSNGAFLLFEMPDFLLIHSLQLSTGSIDSLAINNLGDWIALGSSIGLGSKFDLEETESSQSQLIVWEWQSESFILKQTGAGVGVTNVYECVAYSPDAMTLASGGTDGKIKLWNLLTGFCIATFAQEHRGPITGLEFVAGKSGKVILSASLDGTVRAFDLNRYRNFRTLAAPSESKAAQFICLAVDSISGDIVAAGAHNFFEIFLWSLKTGRFLECLSGIESIFNFTLYIIFPCPGHEGPVSDVSFSPNSNTLVSCSWDKSVRIWELFEGPKCTREVIKLGSDALAVAFRPDGLQFAVATLNGNISFFNPHTAEEIGVPIEGKNDLGMSQSEMEATVEKDKHFSTLCYSADGTFIVAGGKSKFVCIYHANEKLLAKKFAVTWNLSMDGLFEYMTKRKISEFGFNSALIKQRDDQNPYAPIALPGVAKSDLSSRAVSPVITINCIRFSPTMRTFSFASTEGIAIYSLDSSRTFDPYQLEFEITPKSIRKSLEKNELSDALMQALKLNELSLIREVLEKVPTDYISFVSLSLPIAYVSKCLKAMAVIVESTRHIEFYLKWSRTILYQHGVGLKNQTSVEMLHPTLRLLQQNLTRHFEDVGRICQHNKYLLRFLQVSGEKRTRDGGREGVDSDEEMSE